MTNTKAEGPRRRGTAWGVLIVLPNWSTTPVTSTLLLISADGAMREIVLAPHGWLGLPW